MALFFVTTNKITRKGVIKMPTLEWIDIEVDEDYYVCRCLLLPEDDTSDLELPEVFERLRKGD